MQTLEPYLREHPFIEGMREDFVQTLVGCASNAKYDEGEFVFRAGQEADKFIFIRSGTLALDVPAGNRGSVTIQTLSDGEVLGWSWLMPPYHWQIDARAVTLLRCIQIDGKCLRTKCDNDPALGYEIMKRLGDVIQKHLRATRLQLVDMYAKDSKRI